MFVCALWFGVCECFLSFDVFFSVVSFILRDLDNLVEVATNSQVQELQEGLHKESQREKCLL